MISAIKKILFVVVPVICSGVMAVAEDIVDSYKFDFGVSAGMSGYLGDANRGNMYRNPGVAATVGIRYLIDERWAAKAQLGMARLSGDTSGMSLPGGAFYSFKSTVVDLGLRGECNFFAYGIGETYKRLSRWTPYLTVGIGAAMAASGGETAFSMTIPMGVGVKYKPSRRVNLMVEFTMTKALGDKIDSSQLTDLYQIKSSFLKNTDWYSMLTVGISYEFGPRCAVCHRID